MRIQLKLLMCFCFMLACIGFPMQAKAGAPCPVTITPATALHGMAFCNCLMYPGTPQFYVMAPIYQCFTDTQMVNDISGRPHPRGIIPYAAYKIFTDGNMVQIFRQIITSLYSLAVLFLGFKIYMGEMKDVKREVFVVIFKLCAVIYFLGNAHTLYVDLINFMLGLSDIVTGAMSGLRAGIQAIPAYANTVGGQNFWSQCMNTGSGPVLPTTTLHMWKLWDCSINYILGLSYTQYGLVGAGIITFASLIGATVGTGIIIFMLIIYFVGSLLSAIFKFLQSFLMSVLALSFIFLIGYLFIPMILFRSTYGYFNRWLNFAVGAVLTPAVTIGFMVMSLVALDVVLFTGKNSLFSKVAYNFETYNYSANQNNNPLYVVSRPNQQQNQFQSLLQTNYDNLQHQGCSGKAIDAGIGGSGRLSITPGSQTDQGMGASTARLGYEFKGIHLIDCTTTAPPHDPPGCTPPGSGHTPGTGIWDQFPAPDGTPATLYKYFSNILYAVAVACLLVYIMHAVMGYLPSLVGGLVSQGSNIGQMITGSALPGQAAISSGMNTAMSTMLSSGGKLDAAVRQLFTRPKVK